MADATIQQPTKSEIAIDDADEWDEDEFERSRLQYRIWLAVSLVRQARTALDPKTPESAPFELLRPEELPPVAIAAESIDRRADAEAWRAVAAWANSIADAIDARSVTESRSVDDDVLQTFEASIRFHEIGILSDDEVRETVFVPFREIAHRDLRSILADVRQLLGDGWFHEEGEIAVRVGLINDISIQMATSLYRKARGRSANLDDQISGGKNFLARQAARALGCEQVRRGKSFAFRLPRLLT